MENFTPLTSTFGGILIGLSATWLWAVHGRIAGISGITGGLMDARGSDLRWRLSFLTGMIGVGAALSVAAPATFAMSLERSTGAMVLAGVLVGIGTRLGSGCTSGHGVCGISRVSKRSMVATGTFLFTGAVTVTLVTRLLGGSI